MALAGGGALIVRGLVDRSTQDLDFFATSAEVVDQALTCLEESFHAEGLQAERLRVTPGFARLRVSDGEETTLVDLAWDMRVLSTEHADSGEILSEEELAADKILAVANRTEARDFVDLVSLMSRNSIMDVFELASQKQSGLHPGQVLLGLEQFEQIPRADLEMDDLEVAQLQVRVKTLLEEFRRLADLDPRPDPTRFPDFGLEWLTQPEEHDFRLLLQTELPYLEHHVPIFRARRARWREYPAIGRTPQPLVNSVFYLANHLTYRNGGSPMGVKFLSPEWARAATDALASHSGFVAAINGVSLSLQFEVTGGSNGADTHYFVKVSSGAASVEMGAIEKADLAFTTHYSTAAAISKGDLNVQTAFFTGKLKITGNFAKLMVHQAALESMAEAVSHLDIRY